MLDIVFSNMGNSVGSVDVSPPLLPDTGRPGLPSDHNIVTIQFNLPRNFKWLRYSHRKYMKEGEEAFRE